jgi:DNA sulfur modification protein DndC
VHHAIRSPKHEKRIVVLGVRLGESAERDRTISRYRAHGDHFLRQSGDSSTIIFSPILSYGVEDVWATLTYDSRPASIDVGRLTRLYRDAAGECPSIRDPRGSPCGKGRFGCWTCTVVRKDHAMSSMIREGHSSLSPLLAWRNGLALLRDDPNYRCKRRRNGTPGPGPLTLRARRLLLRKLLLAQSQTPWKLITHREIQAIRQLWREDQSSSEYSED